MSHYPLLFFQSSRDDRWIRIYGMIGTEDFMKEYEKAAKP
jgi:hypothetical protein